MALSFHLVKRPDMRKDAAAGSKLFYAQVRSLKKLDFNKLCDLIAVRSTAFIGDVMLVIEGLLSVMEERLEEGDVIQMGRLGNFCKPSLRLQEVVRTVRKSNSNVSIIRHVKTGIYQTISLSRPKGGGMFLNQSGCYPAQSAIETGWGESTLQRNITISSVSPPTDVPTPSGKEPIDIAGYSLMAARLIGGLYKLFTA